MARSRDEKAFSRGQKTAIFVLEGIERLVISQETFLGLQWQVH